MAAAAPIIGAIGVGVQAVSAIRQANSASNAAEAEAARAAQNAVLSRQQAAEDERIFRIQARKQLGDISANFGASGLAYVGTPVDIVAQSAAQAELDALKIRYGGELKAIGYQSDQDLYRQRSSSYQTGGALSAAGYLLGGASKFADYIGAGKSKSLTEG